MAESETAKRIKRLIKSADDLVNTVKKQTAEFIQAAKDLNDQITNKRDEKDEQ